MEMGKAVLLASIILLGVGGIGALACRRNDRWANIIGLSSCLTALFLKLTVLFAGTMLSACFQLPIILLGAAGAIHSIGYMEHHGKCRMGLYWFLFNITLMAMLAVTVLPRGLSFVAAWEIMGLASFALVAFEWKKSEVRQAAWIYLLSCEGGGLLLIWLLMNLESAPFGAIAAVTLAAFGLKAGFPLLHVWLPEAHPAAPAPVSALMSGAMIPLGFCGIIAWCPMVIGNTAAAWVLFFMGLTGMLMGILFGAAQRDLKRLLAYSSVENIGIMTLALALGMLGLKYGALPMTLLAFSGFLLHLINHALLKGTLFLGAGSVYKAAHTLDMDKMGGLIKKMPWTGGVFCISSLGISGLPPFCGFAGELLIYVAAFYGIAYGTGALLAACVTAAVLLAVTGGTAAAAFAKTVSAVFLGEPRSAEAVEAESEQENMVVPMLFTGGAALIMTLIAPWVVNNMLMEAATEFSAPWLIPTLMTAGVEALTGWKKIIFSVLGCNGICALVLTFLTLLFFYLRKNFCRRPDRVGITWDCGYAEPTARMQYTATAFTQPLADLFNGVLRQKKKIVKPENLFPDKAVIEVTAPDGGKRWFWKPLFQMASRISDRVRHLQSGLLHIYILIMVLAVLIMLVWCLLTPLSSGNAQDKIENTQEVVSHE